jgi:putative FmdB family regulatory protein
MPTYEYACKSCGEHLEVVQSFKDDALTECPACGGTLRKVFGNIGIAFKGSGFYKNDSRAAAKSKSSSTEAASAGSKTDTAAASSSSSSSSGDSNSKSSETSPAKTETKTAGEKKPTTAAAS